MKPVNIIALIGLLGAIAAGIYVLESRKTVQGDDEPVVVVAPADTLSAEDKAKVYDLAKEISSPDGFINTDDDGITIGELVGKKVILVDFWTYSCINCQRTTPYLNAWYETYHDDGLEIIGIHTPEFDFEKEYDNVLSAVQKFGIAFPVVLDNDFSTWNAYRNRYWPRKYLIDIDGYIVYDHIGEGGYEETEIKIRELLEERRLVLGETDGSLGGVSSPEGVTAVDFEEVATREIYLGAGRRSASDPVTLEGDWRFDPEFAQNNDAGAKIILEYDAKVVYMVASSLSGAHVRVYRDGVLVNTVFVEAEQLYTLYENPEGYGPHRLELIIDVPGLNIYTFTFG